VISINSNVTESIYITDIYIEVRYVRHYNNTHFSHCFLIYSHELVIAVFITGVMITVGGGSKYLTNIRKSVPDCTAIFILPAVRTSNPTEVITLCGCNWVLWCVFMCNILQFCRSEDEAWRHHNTRIFWVGKEIAVKVCKFVILVSGVLYVWQMF
jgi:hypothetical protein